VLIRPTSKAEPPSRNTTTAGTTTKLIRSPSRLTVLPTQNSW
jgi:hypothetical protein